MGIKPKPQNRSFSLAPWRNESSRIVVWSQNSRNSTLYNESKGDYSPTPKPHTLSGPLCLFFFVCYCLLFFLLFVLLFSFGGGIFGLRRNPEP